MNQKTFLIGDLHGCYDEARELLDRVGPAKGDRIIFLGDLVDRGPKPRECVELAMQFECVLGNHEEKHLQQRRRAPEKLNPDHLRTREQLGDEHYAYFESLPFFIRLPEHDAAAVHAGVFPGRRIEEQTPYHLVHAQCLSPPREKSHWPSKAPADAKFWTQLWTGPERIIFGHSVLDRPLVTEHAVGIDTGAVFGRQLTALELPGWRLHSVPAKRSHGSRGEVAQYVVHGDVRAFS